MTPALEQLEVYGIAAGIIVSVIGGILAWEAFIRRLRARAQAQAAPAPQAAVATLPKKEDPPMSWLSKNIIDPIEKDVEAFFASNNPLSTQLKTSAAAIGTTTLAQVDPIVTEAEAAAEAVIDAALAKLGPIGVIGEAGVAVIYPLLASALNNVIAQKLGVPAPATGAGSPS